MQKKNRVNGTLFKELLKRGHSIQKENRIWDIADSKLWYLTQEQAQAYLDILDSQKYQSDFGPKEMTLIGENLKEILDNIKEDHVNLVDLGCGDGRKAIIFLKELAKKKEVRYCPIDISGYMVEKAIENISKIKIGEIEDSRWNISDFENLENITRLLKRDKYKRNFFLLLGNTLSNFEFHELLYQIRSSMDTGDYLLIGNGLDNNKVNEDVVKIFKNDKKMNNFLIKIPIKLGIDKELLEYNIRFKNSRIEFYYKITNDTTISFQEKSIQFKKGDEIIVATSYHYTKKEFTSFLNLYFDEVETYNAKDDSYTLAFCKK